MSYHQFIVPPQSRVEIRQLAKVVRQVMVRPEQPRIDVVRLIEHALPQVFQGEDFIYEIVPDEELGVIEGQTIPDDYILRLPEHVYHAARRLHDGRARFTVCHEVGHLLLHRGIQLKMARVKSGQQIERFRCSEWQADCFAGELLMDREHFARCKNLHEVAELFGVTVAAARVQGAAYGIKLPVW